MVIYLNNEKCCHGTHDKHKCGKFKGSENKEEKLKHLKDCKVEFSKRIEEIDKTIAKIQSE